jgi:hypothetical protein
MDDNTVTPPTPRPEPFACEYTVNGRNAGLRCSIIEIRVTEIDVLIRRGLMKADARNDANAIRNALKIPQEVADKSVKAA